MDPAGYFKYSRSTSLRCQKFIESVASDWHKTSLEVVMDIGCGAGNTSTYWMDHYFPDIGRLIGIDIDPGMIALAKEKNTKDKIEFYVADVSERDSISKWEGNVDKIVSTHVLHMVQDQRQFFRNVFKLLKPSGEAALYFHFNEPFCSSFVDLYKRPKWKPILEPTISQFPQAHKEYDVAHYKQMFEDIGFAISICEARCVESIWESVDECANFLMSLHSIGDVSNETREEYKKDLIEEYTKDSPKNPEGLVIRNVTMLYAKLRKR